MLEKIRIEINVNELTKFMAEVLRGKFIPTGGRPDHFQAADDECAEGFAGPPADFKIDVEKQFKTVED